MTTIAAISKEAPVSGPVIGPVSGTVSGRGTGADAAWKAKLATGAHQFEAMMLEQMMKPLQFGGVPGADEQGGEADGQSTDAASDIIRGFGTEALAKAIASGGGIGLAAQVIRQVSAEHNSQKVNRDSTKDARGAADGTG